jgi:hypothetical protein
MLCVVTISVMLGVVMLSGLMLGVVKLPIVMLSVIRLNVAAPIEDPLKCSKHYKKKFVTIKKF